MLDTARATNSVAPDSPQSTIDTQQDLGSSSIHTSLEAFQRSSEQQLEALKYDQKSSIIDEQDPVPDSSALESVTEAELLDGFPEEAGLAPNAESTELLVATASSNGPGSPSSTNPDPGTDPTDAIEVANQPGTVPTSQSPQLQVHDNVTVVQPDVLLGSLYEDMEHLYAAVGIYNDRGREDLEDLVGTTYEGVLFSDRIHTYGPNEHPDRNRTIHEWTDRGFTEEELRSTARALAQIDLSENPEMAATLNIARRLLLNARNADDQYYVTQAGDRVSPFELADVTNPENRVRPGHANGDTALSDGRLQGSEFLALGIANPQLIYGGSEFIVHDARSPDTTGTQILRSISVDGSAGFERESGIYTTSGALGVDTDLYTVGNWFRNIVAPPPVTHDEVLRTLGMFGGGNGGPTRVPFALRGQPFQTGLE